MRQQLVDTPETRSALALLDHAYATRLTRSGKTVEHPIAVAELLRADGQPPSVVATGLLHDVLEDTDVTATELRDRFGEQITRWVEALTQDPSIGKYGRRKAALRKQVVTAGPEVAAVTLADKLAKLRLPGGTPPSRKLAHYRETLEAVEKRYGATRLSEQLREALDRVPQT